MSELPGLIARLGRSLGRDMVQLDVSVEGGVEDAIRETEQDAIAKGPWPHSPVPRPRRLPASSTTNKYHT